MLVQYSAVMQPMPVPACNGDSDSTCTEPVLLETPTPQLLAQPQAPELAVDFFAVGAHAYVLVAFVPERSSASSH